MQEITVYDQAGGSTFVVKRIGVYESTKVVCLIFTFCDSGELLPHLANEDELTEKKVAQYFKQLLTAMAYLHGQGSLL